MNCSEFGEIYIDVFYETDDLQLTGRVHRHRLMCPNCEILWQKQLALSATLHAVPEHLPSRLALNRVMAFAAEKAESHQRYGWFRFWLRPLLPASLVVAVWLGFQGYDTDSTTDQTVSKAPVVANDSSLELPDDFFADVSSPVPAPHISYVSTGPQPSGQSFGKQRFSFDDVLDQKKILHSLSLSDVSALFDRGRKLEKLREYRLALNDYEFIANFYPKFENIKAVKFSMARCLSALGSIQDAVVLLEDIRRDDPDNEDVIYWLDQLKSETI